jgi:hypothetical protein
MEKARGATVNTAGSKTPVRNATLQVNFFMTTFCFGVYIVN